MCYCVISQIMLQFSDFEAFTLKGLIMEMKRFFCIANMILDSELLLIIILLSLISWALGPVSHLYTHCIVVVFRAYAWAAWHVYMNLHPASSVQKQYTVIQPFQKNENELRLKYITALKLKKTNCKKLLLKIWTKINKKWNTIKYILIEIKKVILLQLFVKAKFALKVQLFV